MAEKAIGAAVDEFLREEGRRLSFINRRRLKRLFAEEIASEVKALAKKRLREIYDEDGERG
jgi:hypothetical protein